jgi:ATP-dependent RNA helicase RhlE
VSLVCVDEHQLLKDIEKLIKRAVPQEVIPGFEPDPNAKPEPIQRRSQGGGARAPRQGQGQGQGQARGGQGKPAQAREARGDGRGEARHGGGNGAGNRGGNRSGQAGGNRNADGNGAQRSSKPAGGARPVKAQGPGAGASRAEHTRREGAHDHDRTRGASPEAAGRPQRKAQSNPGALLGGRTGGDARRNGRGTHDR